MGSGHSSLINLNPNALNSSDDIKLTMPDRWTFLKQTSKRAILLLDDKAPAVGELLSRVVFRRLDDKAPAVGKPLISALRFLRYVCFYNPVFFMSRWKGPDYDSRKAFCVSPDTIQLYHTRKQIMTRKGEFRFDRVRDKGRVLGGDWDLSVEE